VGANFGTSTSSGSPGARSKPITAAGLKALTAADDGRAINFGESMSGKVRIGRDGVVSVHATWRFRTGGKTREIRIGTWRERDGMSLKALRDERDRLATELRSGVDPIERKAADRLAEEVEQAEAVALLRQRVQEAQAAELAQQRRLSVRELFNRWRDTDLQPTRRADGTRAGRKDGGLFVFQQFTRHVFPHIGDMAVDDLRKAELLAVIDAQKGKPRTAAMLFGDLKQMLSFALDRELIAADPLASVKKARLVGTPVARTRVLSEEELKLLPMAIASARMHPRAATAIWLGLATGVRVGELMGAAWVDEFPADQKSRVARVAALKVIAEAEDVKLGIIDTRARTWYLPDTKNQRDHTIHLSTFAIALFDSLRQFREVLKTSTTGELSPWVFPGTKNGRPVSVKSFGKQLSDRQREPEARLSRRTKATTALQMPDGNWTAHDLRRTTGTLMARLGFGSDVINECLNHIQSDRMARVYIQDRREAQQLLAFDAVGAKLAQLASGECISPDALE
jgi:integrase